MKRWIILAAVVIALSSTATVALQYIPVSVSTDKPSYPVGSSAEKGRWGNPKAVLVGAPVFDFGTMAQQETGKHSWVVKNEGKGVLNLHMISSTCSCTLAKFKDGKKAVVNPGESTEITLEYETRANNGVYEKGAQIGTNDPDLPEFPLHVRGHVYPALLTYPPLDSNVLNLLDLSNDVEEHLSVLGIYSKDRPETKIVKAESSSPAHIRLAWERVPAKDLKSMRLEGCDKLTIAVKSDLPLGTFREEVVVTTDHPKNPEMRLIVTGSLLGPIIVGAPGRLLIVTPPVIGKLGGSGELDVIVAGGRETKFEVVKPPKGLTAAVTPGRLKGHYRLVVTVPPGTPAQNIIDRVELKTDHPKAASVFVPVTIFVTNPQ